MGEQVTTVLEDDVYDRVCDEHEETGKSKSKVVSNRVEGGYNGKEPTLMDTILPTFGEGLFVSGWVVAFLSTFIVGVAMSLLGLGIFIGAKVDEHMEEYDVSAGEALIQVLGA